MNRYLSINHCQNKQLFMFVVIKPSGLGQIGFIDVIYYFFLCCIIIATEQQSKELIIFLYV